MNLLADSIYPIIQAPMAGGPSTVELATQVSESGGIGFLAAGYKTPDEIEKEIIYMVDNTQRPFGINIFVPDADPSDALEKITAYQEHLAPLAQELDVDISHIPDYSDDYFWEKIELIAQLPVPIVSFTFGLPPKNVMKKLAKQGKILIATVTSPQEALLAQEQPFDFICLQGNEAGGHRATFDPTTPPVELGTFGLTQFAIAQLSTNFIIAGGITQPLHVDIGLSLGATAVQVGTAFLLADEAGTTPTHRKALENFRSRKTVLTRAYSGRVARGIENDFITRFDSLAPVVYPRVNSLTQKIRLAGADNPEIINLWAGVNFADTKNLPAKKIVEFLGKG